MSDRKRRMLALVCLLLTIYLVVALVNAIMNLEHPAWLVALMCAFIMVSGFATYRLFTRSVKQA